MSDKTIHTEDGRQALMPWLNCAFELAGLHRKHCRKGIGEATLFRASGAAAERFSRIAEAFVRANVVEQRDLLVFNVEAGRIHESEVGTIRIERRIKPSDDPQKLCLMPLSMEQQVSDWVMFGAEARVDLMFRTGRNADPLVPYLTLRYEVVAQEALRILASVLETGTLQRIWAEVGGFKIATSLTVTRPDDDHCEAEEWSTAEDSDGNRVIAFCRMAGALSDEEVRECPPSVTISRVLDATHNEQDLQRYFGAMCEHVLSLAPPHGGWHVSPYDLLPSRTY